MRESWGSPLLWMFIGLACLPAQSATALPPPVGPTPPSLDFEAYAEACSSQERIDPRTIPPTSEGVEQVGELLGCIRSERLSTQEEDAILRQAAEIHALCLESHSIGQKLEAFRTRHDVPFPDDLVCSSWGPDDKLCGVELQIHLSCQTFDERPAAYFLERSEKEVQKHITSMKELHKELEAMRHGVSIAPGLRERIDVVRDAVALQREDGLLTEKEVARWQQRIRHCEREMQKEYIRRFSGVAAARECVLGLEASLTKATTSSLVSGQWPSARYAIGIGFGLFLFGAVVVFLYRRNREDELTNAGDALVKSFQAEELQLQLEELRPRVEALRGELLGTEDEPTDALNRIIVMLEALERHLANGQAMDETVNVFTWTASCFEDRPSPPTSNVRGSVQQVLARLQRSVEVLESRHEKTLGPTR